MNKKIRIIVLLSSTLNFNRVSLTKNDFCVQVSKYVSRKTASINHNLIQTVLYSVSNLKFLTNINIFKVFEKKIKFLKKKFSNSKQIKFPELKKK